MDHGYNAVEVTWLSGDHDADYCFNNTKSLCLELSWLALPESRAAAALLLVLWAALVHTPPSADPQPSVSRRKCAQYNTLIHTFIQIMYDIVDLIPYKDQYLYTAHHHISYITEFPIHIRLWLVSKGTCTVHHKQPHLYCLKLEVI